MTVHPLSLVQARALALRAQGLDGEAPFGPGIEGARRAVEHLGYVQVDTIAVVERAHHHVLWSRVPGYEPAHLDALLAERRVFEYWAHAAAILPMRDFRQSLPLMRSFRGRFHWAADTPELRRAMRRVLGRIRAGGAMRARDFEGPAARPAAGAWLSAKIEKRALHELWMRGDVMIAGRRGFEKSYDLPARVLPAEVDRRRPTDAGAADFLIRRTLEAHGVMREPEMRYLRGNAALVRRRLALAVRRGWVVPVRVGDQTVPAYALAAALAEGLPAGGDATRARILSPFDNFVIQRERLRWLFGFDYQIECYVPAAKRRFGHFVLPVLRGDRFVARLEAKAVRAAGRLELIGLWFEPGFAADRGLRADLATALGAFGAFNGCPTLADPKRWLG